MSFTDVRNSFLSIPCLEELALIRNGYHSTKDKRSSEAVSTSKESSVNMADFQGQGGRLQSTKSK